MKLTTTKTAILIISAMFMTGCSLLKVSVSTGDPLPRNEVQTRVMTRGFYHDMASDIASAADSIVSTTPNVQIKVRAIRWKMQATRAAVNAAMQAIPEVALADTWILARRMDGAFARTPDSLLFDDLSPIARNTAHQLHNRAQALAREMLSSSRFSLMERFVTDFIATNPIKGDGVGAANTTFAWLQFLKANGIEHAYASGSISDIMADMSDRLGGQTQQMGNTLGWSKDIIELQLQQDSLRSTLGRQLDSLERNFSRMVVVVEHVPQISDHIVNSFSEQVQKMIYSMNTAVDSAFMNFDRQREELQRFVGMEREGIMRDASAAADSAVQQLLKGLPAVVGKIIFWLILLVVVALGLPFGAGFWLGSLRERAQQRKKSE